MITRIREVRRARGMTLDDVARNCEPPTTPQTIGRLETGARTVSVGWLNRIARALGVDAQDLVQAGEAAQINVAAILGPRGATAPKRAAIVVTPRVDDGKVGIVVEKGVVALVHGTSLLQDIDVLGTQGGPRAKFVAESITTQL